MFVIWFFAGWFAWTLGEYVLHRFAMHSLRGRGIASREHLNHHAAIPAPLRTEALSWFGVLVVATGWGLLLDPMFGVGWVGGYGFYYVHHQLAHRRPPRSAYQRWLRRHHFHHHFGHPMANHGVTLSLWDRVFGTYEAPGRIKVPRRMAMVWLVDERGEVRPEFATDYEIVGRRRGVDRSDVVDAYANRAPVLS
jgi:sterol desaturase/sphingolipid hydroxylase (fatty acid hydroxylase superfamily)